MSILSRPAATPPTPAAAALAAAFDCLAGAELTAEQLIRRLSTDTAGSPLPVPHLPAGVALAQIPLADLIAFEPRPDWRAAQQETAAQILASWPTHLARFLAETPPRVAVPIRLAALREALSAQQAQLDPAARDAATAFARVHDDLSREQRRGAPRRGLLSRMVQGATDVVRLSYLHDQHQDRGFAHDVQATALVTTRQAADAVRSLESGLATAYEIAAAALQRMDGGAAVPAAALPAPPDWAPAAPTVGALLADRVPVQSQAMDLLVAPSTTAEVFVSRVEAEATRDAAAITHDLSLEALMELLREAEGYPESTDVYEALIQHTLRAVYARRFVRATRLRARTTLIELTPDGQPECGDALAPVPIFSGPAGSPHQFGWLEFQHGLAPDDLAVVRRALDALAADQTQRNNLLLEEQVRDTSGVALAAEPGGPTAPAPDAPLVAWGALPSAAPALNGTRDAPVAAGS